VLRRDFGENVMRTIHYSYSRASEIRRHYVDGNDVDVLLSRLPEEVWSRLRAVHFNDRSWGRRRLGYVNDGRCEIAICALPPRVSLTKFLDYPQFRLHRSHRSPRNFGAVRGRQWPELAVRRFTLYHVFLHELGHLQVVDSKAKRMRRKFAGETKAQEFADYWRTRLWLNRFDHRDPVHNPPSTEEWDQLDEHEANASGCCSDE
jgi:hypothetical protein